LTNYLSTLEAIKILDPESNLVKNSKENIDTKGKIHGTSGISTK